MVMFMTYITPSEVVLCLKYRTKNIINTIKVNPNTDDRIGTAGFNPCSENKM